MATECGSRESTLDSLVVFRNATIDDLPQVLKLVADIVVSENPIRYADEVLSDPPLHAYIEAFKKITSWPNEAIVGVIENEIVAYLQITYVPGLIHRGQSRAIVEDVRVSRNWRGTNLGRQIMSKAIERAKQNECWVLQLTTNKWRDDAIQFYEKIGFQRTHEGFRVYL
jgi:GNAT superfamily N-acetyltransferase